MSRADHPTYPTCCTTYFRSRPSGRVDAFHAFACKVSPNERIEREAPRAEVASHATRRDRDDEGYTDYWSDLAFELEGGR